MLLQSESTIQDCRLLLFSFQRLVAPASQPESPAIARSLWFHKASSFPSTSVLLFGIITAIAACPAIIGTTEAIRQGQRKSAKEQHRGAKTNLVISCSNSEVDGCAVVLRNGRVRDLHFYLRSGFADDESVQKRSSKSDLINSCSSQRAQPVAVEI